MKSTVTFARPANTDAYLAGDVVGGVLYFRDVSQIASAEVLITSTGLRVDLTAVTSGMTSFRLQCYRETPPSALADNAPWDLPAGDRSVYAGYIDLGSPADVGSTLYVQADQVNKHLKLTETGIYAYLTTIGAYTPASATVMSVDLHAVPL
jgi:hypothetical protein